MTKDAQIEALRGSFEELSPSDFKVRGLRMHPDLAKKMGVPDDGVYETEGGGFLHVQTIHRDDETDAMKGFFPDEYDEEYRKPESFLQAIKTCENLEGCSLTLLYETNTVRLMTLWNFDWGDAWSLFPVVWVDRTTSEWIKLLGIARGIASRQLTAQP